MTCFTSFSCGGLGSIFLIQVVTGVLYKIDLVSGLGVVVLSSVQYFGCIGECCSLCVMRSGYIFAAGVFGEHVLYRIVGLGGCSGAESAVS